MSSKNLNILIVIDMQNDFIDGVLGSTRAQEIVPQVADLIKEHKGPIIYTKDTHGTAFEDYSDSRESMKFPPHCILDTEGWHLNEEIAQVLSRKDVPVEGIMKDTFGAVSLPEVLKDYGLPQYESKSNIFIVGLVTDICVISNAMILKAAYPKANIIVMKDYCAGSSEEMHDKALEIMEGVQIDVI